MEMPMRTRMEQQRGILDSMDETKTSLILFIKRYILNCRRLYHTGCDIYEKCHSLRRVHPPTFNFVCFLVCAQL